MQAMVIGEAPGKWELSGPLWDTLEKFNVSRIRCSTTSVLTYYYDGKISKKLINEGRERVLKQIAEVRPKFVLLLGNTPLTAITGKAGIKQKRGRPFEQDGIIYLPCYAPGLILRDERNKPEFEADLALFGDILKRGGIPKEEGLNYTIVDSARKFKGLLAALHGTVSFDIETNGLYPWADDAKVISIGFGTNGRQWCLPIAHPEQGKWNNTVNLEMLFAQLDDRMQECYLVAHNGKFDSLWLKVHHGVDWRCDFDTMLAHYLCDENSKHSLKLLAQVYYGAPNYDVDKDTKQGAGPLGKHCEYLAHDVYYTRRLRFTLGKEIERDPGVQQLWTHIMMPVAHLFVDVEYHGVYIDINRMAEVEQHLKEQKAKALRTLKKYSRTVNWGSPKQLAKFLFEDLGLEVLDRTKKGAPSTSESVLLRIEHPVTTALLELRAAQKNLSTFIKGWKPFLKNCRLHPTFKLHGAVTGRPSCEHPNLQQVPRDPLIRSLITAPNGWVLLDIDLSQIELRIAAELSGDQELLRTFEANEDAHWLTATREIGRAAGMPKEVLATAKAFGEKYATTPWLKDICTGKKLSYGEAIIILYRMGPELAAQLNPIWKEMRKKAKAVNFGYLFGMWWKKFKIYARDNYGVIVSDEEAQASRKNFFELYKQLGAWHDRQKRYARRNGFVRALSGRKRRLPAAMLPNDCPERAEAWRQAINSPVQGFANDLNLMTALQLSKEFPKDIRIVGTVHDAILMEVRRPAIAKVYVRALEVMRRPALLNTLGIKIRVPIKGEAAIGPWSKGVSLQKYLAANDNRKIEDLARCLKRLEGMVA